jgi:hypothetical protein
MRSLKQVSFMSIASSIQPTEGGNDNRAKVKNDGSGPKSVWRQDRRSAFNSAGWLCQCAKQGSMSKRLKQFLFGIWGLLLIPLITPILEKWLEENVFADPNGMATTVFRDAVATIVFNNLLALGQQRWFKFVAVFLTGIVIGVSLEWLNRKSDEKKAYELRSLGSKFRSLSDSIKTRTASSGWPDDVRDLKPAILSAFISARKFGLWAPNEHVYQLPDASFLCEYFRSVGKLLEDGHFDNANSEALSWKPFLDKMK